MATLQLCSSGFLLSLLFLASVLLNDAASTQKLSQIVGEDSVVQIGRDLPSLSLDAKRSNSRQRRSTFDNLAELGDVICQHQETNFLDKLKGTSADSFAHTFTFKNETNYSLALAWTGSQDGRLLVAITEENLMFALPSRLYLSVDDGKNFTNITPKVDNKLIRKDNGLQKHPNSDGTVFIVVHTQDDHSRVYITEDGGDSFKSFELPFLLESKLLFHPKKADLILALEQHTRTLYLSTDKGRQWSNVKSGVSSVKWSTFDEDPFDTFYAIVNNDVSNSFFSLDSLSMSNRLEKCSGKGCSWEVLREEVYTFGMEGRFLYVSKITSDPQSKGETTRIMEVSSDGGHLWNEVQLPTVTSDRFYSILDMNEKMIFMHVDNPGDTGHGTLYISDATGIIFSESLQRHLYPNFMDVTDFYRVQSMRGVYLASQMEDDNSIHTMITYDRGGIWQPVPRPNGVPCKDESKICNLQIHNQYSMASHINAQLPLSSPNAVGIVIVHGHVADVLQNTDPDVFVSSDGGYSWRLALKGPHHYQIADQGGLLVAVPSDTLTPRIIKFSTDEGRCWHEYEFTSEAIIFKRLLTEPGNKEMNVAIWGYHQDTNMWKTIVIDFKTIIDRPCVDIDYEKWTAHFDNSDDPEDAGCLLGTKETFFRLKKDSWCFNGHSHEGRKSAQDKCTCTQADFDCDYGYYRSSGSGLCRLDPAFKGSELDICYRGHMEELVNLGYHKMPGDVCVAGFSPPADRIVNLKERCNEGDKHWVAHETHQAYYQPEREVYNGRKNFMVAVVVVAALLSAFIAVAFFVRKYGLMKRNVTFRYSTLSHHDGDFEDDVENKLNTGTSLYDDSDEEEDPVPTSTQSGPTNTPSSISTSADFTVPPLTKVKAYHDDSDDDLLT